MKKKILLFAILSFAILSVFGLYGCCDSCPDTTCPDNPNYNGKGIVTAESEEILKVKDADDWTAIVARVYTFKYKNHSYIAFRSSSNGGIIHDPDCECHNKDKKSSGTYFDW